MNLQIVYLLSAICFAHYASGFSLDLLSLTSETAIVAALNSISSYIAETVGTVLEEVFDNRTIDQEVTFWCGKRGYSRLQQTFVNDSNISSKLDLSKPIAIITHGWLSKSNVSWVQQMAGNYSLYVDSNVCTVDWSTYARYGYGIAAKRNVPLTGNYLGVFMKFLQSAGISPSKMTLIGHSLGAHVSSLACKQFNGQVKELYGLDAAGPLFTMPVDVGTKNRIASTDAAYVQVIYTTRNLLGIGFSVGQQNFFPNGGYYPQPSCLASLLTYADAILPLPCSHSHAHQLFTLSLNPALTYRGKKCSSYVAFKLGLCFFSPTDVLGIYAKKTKGDFYFDQKIMYPFV